MRNEGRKNLFLAATAALACPCHLPFLLPALAGFVGGAAGAFIGENTGLLIALATGYFVGVAAYFLRRARQASARGERD
jgi:uncharacterized membrane protein